MSKIWSLIPTPYKIGGLFALCAVVLLGLGIYRSHLIATGYDRAVAEYEAKAKEAEERAMNEIIALQSKYKRLYDSINSTPDNGVVCSISRGVIDVLPEPSNHRK